MKTYTVDWSIDIDAETPEEAARIAKEIQLDSKSIANFFTVFDGESIRYIDLDDLK